ncbi:unnamed protein product [Brassica oleracea var. botrytis]
MTLSSVLHQFPICSPIRKKKTEDFLYTHTHKRTEWESFVFSFYISFVQVG